MRRPLARRWSPLVATEKGGRRDEERCSASTNKDEVMPWKLRETRKPFLHLSCLLLVLLSVLPVRHGCAFNRLRTRDRRRGVRRPPCGRNGSVFGRCAPRGKSQPRPKTDSGRNRAVPFFAPFRGNHAHHQHHVLRPARGIDSGELIQRRRRCGPSYVGLGEEFRRRLLLDGKA